MEKIELTLGQKQLLELLKHDDVYDYFESLKKIHFLGTYVLSSELVELSASADVHILLDAIQKIVIENLITKDHV